MAGHRVYMAWQHGSTMARGHNILAWMVCHPAWFVGELGVERLKQLQQSRASLLIKLAAILLCRHEGRAGR